MTSTHFRAGALACALLASTALATPALAQVTSPTFRQVDENGVDLVQGDLVASFNEGTIGSGDGALGLVRMLGLAGASASQVSQWDPIRLNHIIGNGTFVDFGTRHDKFPGAESRGATLSGGGGSYQYTTPDGMVIAFGGDPGEGDTSNFCRSGGTIGSCILVPTSITSPNGKTVTLEYEFWQRCSLQTPPGQPPSPDDPLHCDFTPRLKKASNSFTYSIEFAYASGLGGGPNSTPPATFYQRTTAKFFNDAVSTTVPQASVSYAYPSAGVTDITDMGGRVWRLTGNSTTVAIRRPGAGSNTTSYTLNNGKVSSATVEGVTTSYSRSVVGSTITMTVTDALARQTVVTSDATVGRPSSIKDPLNRTTSFQYDANGRLTRTTALENNYVQLTYDARGNVTETRAVAKSGPGPSDIVATASYDASCANPKTCNKPNTTTDPRGKVTDYSYNATHGGVETVTAPAPTVGGTRPQTRYSYTPANGEYLLTGVSSCQTLGGAFGGNPAACAGTADEVKTTLHYNSRGNVEEVESGNGNGTLKAVTKSTYDPMGNLLTVDGPLAGADDTTRYRYNAARELIGTVSPDPDGGGSLKPRATRNSYTDGLLTKVETGNVASPSDPDWAAFDPAEVVDVAYDANARVKTRKLSSDSGTAYALTQASHDALGRVECVATRMNPAIYGSLPTSACSLGTQGSFGPDRIAKTVYNEAGEVIEQRVAVGVAGQEAAEASFTYTANGKLATLKDAENNLTTYEYDGHDRLSKTRFPVTAKGANASSATDYEQLGYDAAGNVTSRRLRDGQNITYGYDDLNRLTSAILPGEWDEAFGYDLLGRMTSASKEPIPHVFTWDALGRQTAEGQIYGVVNRQFDLAGRLTRLTWQDGFHVDYDRRVTGEISKVRENGATSGVGVLASFAYDDLGRRTSLTRGNGTVTSYGYDPVSRLASQGENLAGTASDQSVTFTHNPANQIVTRTESNNAYAWTGHGSGSTASTSNGLNQLASIGGGTPTYDGRGNLTFDPTTGRSFTYWSDNELVLSGSHGFGHDAFGRIIDVSASAVVNQRFVHDGVHMVAAADPAGITERYVRGDGPDELIAWYEGSGTTTRRWAHQDERGSVVAVSDASGNAVAINRYDEYGRPQTGNIGRFQYTGQLWLPEIGLYHYKARAYAPHLGRFMQTDPIGYWGGPNVYAYVGNDPVNWIDPSGLCTATWDDIYKGYLDGSEEWVGTENFRLNCPSSGAEGGGPQFYGGGGRPSDGPGRSDGSVVDEDGDFGETECSGPPKAPGTGMSEDALKALAVRNAQQARGQGLFWFRNQVRNRGPWDYKQRSRGFTDFGNYNYGYAGAALGLALDFLLRQAGYAQTQAGTSRSDWGDPGRLHGMIGGSPPYGDDPQDQKLIEQGYEDFNNACK